MDTPAAPADLETNGRLPATIAIDPTQFSFSPNELRAFKAATGKTLTDTFSDDADEADRYQVMVWVELRRRGYQPTWDEAGDVGFAMGETEASDPTPTDTSPGSPRSVTSGAIPPGTLTP